MSSYVLSADAEADVVSILEYTFDRFGEAQMIKYKNQLDGCIYNLSQGKQPFRMLEVTSFKVRYLHCQKHYIFGLIQEDNTLIVLAILHEKMDIKSRVQDMLRGI